jgi:hypothetical protein
LKVEKIIDEFRHQVKEFPMPYCFSGSKGKSLFDHYHPSSSMNFENESTLLDPT